MSVDTTTATEAAPAPADEEAPAVRERSRNRRRGLAVPASFYVAAAGAVAVLSLAAAAVGLGVTEYQSQLVTVKVLEARADARVTAGPVRQTRFVDAKTRALLADPVFSSPEWLARVKASREVLRVAHEADLALVSQAGRDVWWPGLSGRVAAAGGKLVPFDPAAGDGAELAAGVVDALKVCEMSDQAGFVSSWVAAHPVTGVSAYEGAVARVFPALAKAAMAHVCTPESRLLVKVPIDRVQRGG